MSGPHLFTLGAENTASIDFSPVLDVQNGRQDQGKQSNWEREWWMLCQLEYLNDSSSYQIRRECLLTTLQTFFSTLTVIHKFPAELLQNLAAEAFKHSSVCFLMFSLMLMQQLGELSSFTENALLISFSAKLEVHINFHRC